MGSMANISNKTWINEKSARLPDGRKNHYWSRQADWKLSALCGYGRHHHEGLKWIFTRTCKGRNCDCWCHKEWTTDMRDQINDAKKLLRLHLDKQCQTKIT